MKIASKLSLLFGLLLLVASSASAQGGFASFISWRYTPAGAFPNGGATITICTSGATGAPCTPTVTVYQDSALTIPVANPLAQCTTSPQVGCIDNLGNVSFYASAGIYSYTITGAGLTPYGPIPVLAQPTSGSGGSGPTLEVNGTLTSSQILQNIVNSTADVVGLHCTANNPSGGVVKPCEITGSSYSGNAATATSATTATTAGSATTAGNLTGAPALPNGTSATTQTLGDNTTKLATDAFVLANISGGTAALSGITAATGSNLINSGNFEQIWNWNLTGNAPAFLINETTASTGGTGTSQRIMEVLTDAGSTAVPLTVGDALTGSQTLPAMYLPCSWNTTGVVDACLLMNVTNTASGSGSKLMDLQVGGSSQFSVDKGGNTLANGSMTAGGFIGNASTATALASTPTQCGGVQFAQGIAAGGNANCATPVTANLVTGGLGVAISPNCPASGNPQCVYSPVNTQFTYDAVFNGTSTVTSATAAFTSADTGKQIAGFCSGTSEFGTSAQTVTYVNATTITASTTAAGSCSGGTLIWGNDDTAALTQASTEIAALSPPCGLISLPSGIMWDTAAQWTTITSKCEALGPGADDWLYAVYGQSRAATIIFAAPSFNFSSCTGDTLLCFGGGPNALGKFTIWGGGWTGSPSGANGKFAVGVTFNDSNMDDVQVEQWLGPPSSATFGCMYLSGQNTQAMHPICDYTGKMELSGNMVQLWNGFSGTPNSGPSLEFSSNCVPLCKSHNGAWSGGQGTVSIQLDTSAIAVLDSDNCQGSATARACLSIGSGATAVLTNKCQMTPTGGVSAEAVYFAAANSTLSAKDCVFTGGATIGSFSSGGAGYGIINDLGGNTCTNCFLTFSGLLHNYAMEPSLGGACLNASGSGPEACGASSHGIVAIPTTTTSYVINTIAAYAGMRVLLNFTTSNSGIPSSPTCVAPSTLGDIYVSAISAGTSFTLTLPSTSGIVCVDWSIQ